MTLMISLVIAISFQNLKIRRFHVKPRCPNFWEVKKWEIWPEFAQEGWLGCIHQRVKNPPRTCLVAPWLPTLKLSTILSKPCCSHHCLTSHLKSLMWSFCFGAPHSLPLGLLHFPAACLPLCGYESESFSLHSHMKSIPRNPRPWRLSPWNHINPCNKILTLSLNMFYPLVWKALNACFAKNRGSEDVAAGQFRGLSQESERVGVGVGWAQAWKLPR